MICVSMQRRALFSGLMRLRMSQNNRPEAPSPATAANGSAAAKEENPAARALVSSSKAEAESEQGAQSGGVRRLAIDVLPSGFHRAGELPSAEYAQCATNTRYMPRAAQTRLRLVIPYNEQISPTEIRVVSVGAALFLFQQFATSMEDLEPLRLFQYTICDYCNTIGAAHVYSEARRVHAFNDVMSSNL
ncbi:hypothetical protein S245_060164, partial [Arachis hypogaea]